jgi:uncharacterized protein YndB with AHSA1/START domain
LGGHRGFADLHFFTYEVTLGLLETLSLVAAAVIAIAALARGAGSASVEGNDPSTASDSLPPVLGDSNALPPSAPGPSLLDTWAQAIFNFEGGKPGDRNVRNNNPGNLKYAGQPAAIGKDAEGFAVFATFEDGWNALLAQLNKFIKDFPSFSILQITAHYLGQDTNNISVTSQGNPFTYAAKVAAALGVSTTATLSQTFGG